MQERVSLRSTQPAVPLEGAAAGDASPTSQLKYGAGGVISIVISMISVA
jgi:hypothetical protein